MQIRVYDDAGADRDCLLVLGWGNRCRHANVQWLVDQVAAHYRTHVVELPTHITDVHREWVDPVRAYAADLDSFPILAHSAGGLTTALFDVAGVTNRVYLSPWWGSDYPLPGPVVDAIASLPVSKPVIPTGELEGDAIGDLATEAQLADGPDNASPAFLGTTRRAQARLPPGREDAVTFCTLTDQVVDPRAIGRRLPADRIRLYEGGHELFSSSSRERHIDTVLDALEHGPDAL